MKLGYLADHPEFIPTLAQWHHSEWAYLRPGDTLEARIERLRGECGHREIPTVIIAFADDILLGSAMLLAHDMDTRMELSPWLAGVFVASDRRGCGVGTTLVRRVMDEATALGVQRLFLYTPSAEHFYARLGWSFVERVPYRGADVVVMSHDCAAQQSVESVNREPNILETERLALRKLGSNDADFILELVNDPAWVRFIGDKGLRTVEDARAYILNGPVKMYAQFGFGLWLVELKGSPTPVGICGLIKRESLEDVDVGFAFLERYRGQSYAVESASAVMSLGKKAFSLTRVVAVMSPGNDRSARLLGKLGFLFERVVRLSSDGPEVYLYGTDL